MILLALAIVGLVVLLAMDAQARRREHRLMPQLRFASLEFTPEGAITRFPDGSSYGALPHDEPHYHVVAHRLGYEGDILSYCREHELAHHLIAESFGGVSRVIWSLAHDDDLDPYDAACEESLAMTLQRYARANEVPLIEGVAWDALKARLLSTAASVA